MTTQRDWDRAYAEASGDHRDYVQRYKDEPSPNPRDPDPSREGIFRDYNCWKCQSGAKPCVQGEPWRCEFPHARND